MKVRDLWQQGYFLKMLFYLNNLGNPAHQTYELL